MRRGIVIAIGVLYAALTAFPAGAQQDRIVQQRSGSDQPVVFKADRIRHDKELGIVVASGNVEIAHDGRILKADTVSYNRREDLLIATGNIVLLEPSGEVYFADHMELTGDFKNGIVENIRVRLTDDSRIAAVGGRRIGGTRTEMRKAVYSPCLKCPDNPALPPLWQIKAVKITHDRAARQVEYRDAFLEFLGIPIAYTPYFSHPDPTVKRRSGLLTPTYGSDQEFGVMVTTPYYFAIAPDKDATFSPTFTSKENVVLAGEYRQRFVDGRLKLSGSGTNASVEKDGQAAGNDIRGHFFGEARFDLNDTWRAGVNIELTSDDTYLRRYKITSNDTLKNHAFLEGFRGRNYAAANAYNFRGLRETDNSATTPLLVPLLDYNFIGRPDARGGRWNIAANLMNLSRETGADSRRLSLDTGWTLPFMTRSGEIYNFFATLRTDAYWVNDVQEAGKPAGSLSSGFTGRIFPKIGLDWRFPFARSDKMVTQIIEPVAGVIVAPNGGNPDRIPNEDSSDFELDDTNFRSATRFPGLDRVDGGQRIHYGLKLGVYGAGGGFTTAFIGQSYRFRKDTTFSPGSGLDDYFSDIIGRIRIHPKAFLKLHYRFRVSKENLRAQRSELSAQIGPPALNLTADYIFIDQNAGSGEFADREEITAALASRLTTAWSVRASIRRDLTSGGGSLNHGFSLTYDCDCFTFTASFLRSFTRDRDLKPTDTIMFRLLFKTLGEIKAVAPG